MQKKELGNQVITAVNSSLVKYTENKNGHLQEMEERAYSKKGYMALEQHLPGNLKSPKNSPGLKCYTDYMANLIYCT